MRKSFLWIPCALLAFSFAVTTPVYKTGSTSLNDNFVSASLSSQLFNQYVDNIYQVANLELYGMDKNVLAKALTGYYNLKIANKLSANSSVITVVDLAKSSCSKRMWIIDLQKQKLVLNTWVAHGLNSGDDVPSHFSNDISSYESSIGFYVTDNVYMGKHGRSLKLDGMDEGFNDNAKEREIVLHGAPYVCTAAIRDLGRLGRSQGCPAVAPEIVNRVIEKIKGKNMLFINGNDDTYNSKYLNADMAASLAFHDSGDSTKTML